MDCGLLYARSELGLRTQRFIWLANIFYQTAGSTETRQCVPFEACQLVPSA
jgi:hypothetical protein